MQIASSASCRYWLPASAVLWTQTVSMPSSLQARMMRRAISPRLAIRIRLNMRSTNRQSVVSGQLKESAAGVHFEERLVELDGFPVFAEHGDDFAADLGGDFVE